MGLFSKRTPEQDLARAVKQRDSIEADLTKERSKLLRMQGQRFPRIAEDILKTQSDKVSTLETSFKAANDAVERLEAGR